jgi:hypothetical protein
MYVAPRSHRASRLHVYFRSADMLRQFDDGAQIYNCTFEGPRQIMRFGAGRARARSDGDFDLELFHITNPTAASNIRASHEIRSSAWNLQGIRRLKNVAYIYLTTLPSVGTEDDLRRIAMASGGKIGFQTTSSRLIEEELQMTVYREDTTGRTTPLPVTVPSAYLAPSHLLLNRPGTVPAYYEVVGPEIVRVGVKPGATLRYDGCTGFVNAEDLKRFDYLVLGDAAEVEGLAAPFDEEETGQIMHLERLALGEDIFSFWWDHRNSDLVTGRAFESRQLAPDTPS